MLHLPRCKVQLTLTLLGLFLSTCALAQQPYYGHFVGNLILTPIQGEGGSRMRLLQPYAFIDSSGGTWYAPAGTVTDGASIPQAAKSLIGGSWDGPYRYAAVIHDVACVQKNRPWELVHLTFYHAMLASSVSPRMAKIMYGVVYHLGPRWDPGGAPQRPSNRLPPVRNNGGPAQASSGCSTDQYEQCRRIVLGAFGAAKDCKCLPKVGGSTSLPQRLEVHPKAEAVHDRTSTDAEVVAKLASYIDAKEREGGISIEEIQKLHFQTPP